MMSQAFGDIYDSPLLSRNFNFPFLPLRLSQIPTKMPAHPDSNLHPEATGAAKALVEKHRAEQPLKLYAGWFCP
jgi:hypothetical protein